MFISPNFKRSGCTKKGSGGAKKNIRGRQKQVVIFFRHSVFVGRKKTSAGAPDGNVTPLGQMLPKFVISTSLGAIIFEKAKIQNKHSYSYIF